jgi:uncharacterized repeat protein (TIGR03803 family)
MKNCPLARVLQAALLIFVLLNSLSGWSATEKTLFQFEVGNDGFYPESNLVADSAGNLYGTTFEGGTFGYGTVFKLTSSAGKWQEKILYNFSGNTDGGFPFAGLVFDATGNLYGTTLCGGDPGCSSDYYTGTVFRLSPRGTKWSLTTLHSFGSADGYAPYGGLVLDQQGNLYGTTSGGGSSGGGVAFELDSSAGWAETILHSFGGPGDGAGPRTPLIFDSAGSLYGTTENGRIFELTPMIDGSWAETILYSSDYNPLSGIAFDSQGDLLGTSPYGGDPNCRVNGYSCGFVFELTPSASGSWSETNLHNFTGGEDGAAPSGGVTLDPAGNLFGTASAGGDKRCGNRTGCGVAYELTPLASGGWSETIVYRFHYAPGIYAPSSSLLRDTAGNFYGTSSTGGSGNVGGVFELSPSGDGPYTGQLLKSFQFGREGLDPNSTLLLDSQGTFYGAAYRGGHGFGGIFQLTTANGQPEESLIYGFAGGLDGSGPQGELTMDAAGNLYGTTQQGGGGIDCELVCGVVFKLQPNSNGRWTETVLYRFTQEGEGKPLGTVVLDASGNLYGLTNSVRCRVNCGTLYQLTPTEFGEWLKQDILVFDYTEGHPGGGLAIDGEGNLYGAVGGQVFKLANTSWQRQQLYTFVKKSFSINTLKLAGPDHILGAISNGGRSERGLVFALANEPGRGWQEKGLYTFSGGTDGGGPSGGLTTDASGNIYGTTNFGGDPQCNCGVVFKIAPTASSHREESVLYTFTDGGPSGGLVMDSLGNLFGAAPNLYYGQIYEVTP